MDPQVTKTTRSGISRGAETGRPMVERALRHELRIPVRYRREGQEQWVPAEAINMSSSGLLFASNELLEIDTRVEITFQTSDPPLLQRSTLNPPLCNTPRPNSCGPGRCTPFSLPGVHLTSPRPGSGSESSLRDEVCLKARDSLTNR
jgi:PilZ domain-containing protein